MKKIFLLLAIVLTVQRMTAQSPNERIFAPLYLYTTGQGQIYPPYDGQMLRVGHTYSLKAVPDPGYKFASWQSVSIITQILYVQTPGGDTIALTNTILNVDNQYIMRRELTFKMQPAETVSAGGGNTITQSEGWQANFVPK
jgi:hypothetical protein